MFHKVKLIELTKKYSFWAFLIGFFLLRLPPVYTLPVRSGFFNSHSIARYILLIAFATAILLIYWGKEKLKIDKTLIILVLLLFLFQSLSIFGAINPEAFIFTYKDNVFGMIVFILAFIFLNSKERINWMVKLLVITILIDIIFEIVVYFKISPFFALLNNILYDKYWEVFDINLRRDRFFVDIFDAALIPFVFYLAFSVKNRLTKLYFYLMSAVVGMLAFISNFRTQLIMTIFSYVGSFLIFIIARKTKVFMVLPVLIAILILGFAISIKNVGYNSLDRLLDPAEEDISTINTRLTYWSESIKMAIASPLFGVGLGNFYDRLIDKETLRPSLFDPEGKFTAITDSHPHSIFFGNLAESGFLALAVLVLLLGYFIRQDIGVIIKRNLLASCAAVSFWSLFIYAVINPPDTVQFMSLFWVLRAVISKSTEL